MSDEIKNIIEPFLEDGQILMDVTHDVRGNFIRIIVDSEQALTLNDTANLTRSIKNSVETVSGFPDGVRIEVSTPGLDWPLSKPFQYRKNLNRNLEVVYNEDKSSTNITGKIISVGDESFELESGNKTLSLDYDQVKSALVKISFK
jgi:ribosome maturation factor RimP